MPSPSRKNPRFLLYITSFIAISLIMLSGLWSYYHPLPDNRNPQRNQIINTESFWYGDSQCQNGTHLGDWHLKNKEVVCFRNFIITGADPATYEVHYDWWGKDRYAVYHQGIVQESIDPNTVTFINELYASDYIGVYAGNGSYGNKVKTIPNADPKTFSVFDNDSYSKDAKHVYFHNGETAIMIKGADPQSFSFLKDGEYAVDAFNVFYYSSRINNADPLTFEKIPGTVLMKDQSGVYYQGKKVELNPDTVIIEKNGIIRDDKNVYIGNDDYGSFEKVPGADPNTFQFLGHCAPYKGISPNEGYFKDSDKVYSHTPGSNLKLKAIENADSATFQYLNSGYAKDKNKVYFDCNAGTIQGADPVSFQRLDGYFSKDKESVYIRQNILEGADVNTFVTLQKTEKSGSYLFAKDKNNVYSEYGTIMKGVLLENCTPEYIENCKGENWKEDGENY